MQLSHGHEEFELNSTAIEVAEDEDRENEIKVAPLMNPN